ncbi:MAG: TetR/AcrR family transcriptional regulator [Armatimonadetes bacterium]|nr:TetR/AcrR family transcriptional regulator [Armatimonadota bacterium]
MSRPPRTRRQAQAEARREQLLAVALDVFAERGVRGSSIRDIAHAAGITEGLIYHYFPSKSALVQAVIHRFAFADEVTSLIGEMKGIPAREAFYRLAWRYFELLSRNRTFVTMLFAEVPRDPEVARAFAEVVFRGFQAVRQFAEKRIAAGEVRPHDVTIALRLVHGSILWFFLMYEKLSPPLPPIDPETFVRGAVDLVMDGIALSPGREEAGR